VTGRHAASLCLGIWSSSSRWIDEGRGGRRQPEKERECGHVGERRCKKDGVCKFDDDIWKVLTAMQEADGVVLGAPIYYWQLSSQMRTLIDRTYAFLKPDYSTRWKPGKRIVFISSQGFEDASAYTGVHKELVSIFGEYAGFKVMGDIIMAGGDDPSAARSRKDMMDAARHAGEMLA
jgi:multimeric flavodoxin WrbA